MPIPFHIEVISALVIHPRYTTQAHQNERPELASRSITLLRNILEIFGPINASFGEAFSFSPVTTSGRSSRRSRHNAEVEDASSESDTEGRVHPMGGMIANSGRIRRCAKDFWHTVGWALNCSVKHPQRWRYWKVWLDFMLDVLDKDWNERDAQDKCQNPGSGDEYEYNLVRKSLLVNYLADVKGRSSAMKRVVRSAFADGGLDSLREFPEVFPNETKDLTTTKGQYRKKEAPVYRTFGEYVDDEEESRIDSSQVTDQEEDLYGDGDDFIPKSDPWLGGPESIALRQRVITLVSSSAPEMGMQLTFQISRVAAYLPDCFAECRDVYEIIYTCVKPLPLPAFSLMLSSSQSSTLPVPVFVSLSQLLLLRLLPMSAPSPQLVSQRNNDDLSQDIIERCFLPFSAITSSVSDNAKVSILVENVLALFVGSCQCYHTPSLDAAIEKGILARENKIKGDKRRRGARTRTQEEESERLWLTASSRRLRSLLSWVEYNDVEAEAED